MIRNRIFLKTLAILLIIEIVGNTVWPTVSYALTSGPTAPEFSNFEPVDTTDLVNLATGELVYNIPLLEVPGPGGGYPLSLSYHSGIKNEAEASWVGLGWTLNPGAIGRNVNGFADDAITMRRDIRDYWAGGSSTTKTYTLGLNIPSTGIGVSYTLAQTRDTYKGFSSEGIMGISINPFHLGSFVSAKMAANAEKKVGQTSNSDQPASDKKPDPAQASPLIGLVNQFNPLISHTSIGISISSNSVKASLTVAGHTFNQKNARAGIISSATTSQNIGYIPLDIFGDISLKRYHTRYWSDQSDALFGTGALYPAIGNSYIGGDSWTEPTDTDNKEFKSYAFDIYNIYDGSSASVNDDADPTRQIGGSLPAYDQFVVTGQGIGGVMQPFIFENGDLHGQNTYWQGASRIGPPTLKHLATRSFTAGKKVDFRFLNDFSNSLTVTPAELDDNAFDFSIDQHTVTAAEEGYVTHSNMQKLAGSRGIEWFTNQEIYDGKAKLKGFIDCYSNQTLRKLQMDIYNDYLQPEALVPYSEADFYGRNSGIVKTDKYRDNDPFSGDVTEQNAGYASLKPRTISLASRIGGFMITNESGVTYHYALPVYGYNEYTRLKMRKPKKGAATITEIKNPEPYATTWLLTAITGPDYVDRGGADNGPNGILDDADWGYWVKFDYGKWSAAYQWRTPFTGYQADLEGEYDSFSYGIKELYYLDAIETKTHKAIFIKSKRKDGRGVTSRLEGGSNPRRYRMRLKKRLSAYDLKSGLLEYNVSPVSTMKLDAIYLFDKKTAAAFPLSKASGDKYTEAPESNPHVYYYSGYNYSWQPPYGGEAITITSGVDAVRVSYHDGDAVFDKYDIMNIPDFKSRAAQVIEFNTDYSLTPGVSNSIGYFEDVSEHYPDRQPYTPTNGTNYTCVEGNYDFDFEWPLTYGGFNSTTPCYDISQNPQQCNLYLTDFNPPQLSTGYDRNAGAFYSRKPLEFMNFLNCDSYYNDDYAGDLFTYYKTGKLTLKGLTFLGRQGLQLVPPMSFAYGKNPDYSGKFDEWGYYKSDYKSINEFSSEAVSTSMTSPSGDVYEVASAYSTRRITAASAADVDAWSLSEVRTPLGAKTQIKYEANRVNKSVYNDFNAFSIAKVERISSNAVRIFFKEKGLNLSQYFAVNQPVTIESLVIYNLGNSKPGSKIYQGSPLVSQINGDNIVITSSDLSLLLSAGQTYVDPATGTSYSNPKPYFIAGVARAGDNTEKFVGGVRVSSIAMENMNSRNVTEYHYTKPGTTISSGVTSFKPYIQTGIKFPTEITFFDNILSRFEDQDERKELLEFKTKFQKVLNEPYENIIMFVQEAPAPGAMYEFVTVRSKTDDVYHDNYTTHHFQPFSSDMISLQYVDNSNGNLRRTATLKNNAVDVGNLREVTTYATADNVMLHKTAYGYLYDENDDPLEQPIKDKKQGIVEQAFQKSIALKYYTADDPCDPICDLTLEYASTRAVVTKREDRSNVVTSVIKTNAKTGVTQAIHNLQFDFYSGKSIRNLTLDGTGTSYVTDIVPAYTIYPSMGLSANGGVNMLSQEAFSVTYKVVPGNPNQKLGLVSASAVTWSNKIPKLEPEPIVSQIFTIVEPRGLDGLHDAVSAGSTTPLKVGSRIEFVHQAVNYFAQVVDLKIKLNFNRVEYKLKLMNGSSSITSDLSNVTASVSPLFAAHGNYSFVGDDNVAMLTDGLYPIVNNELPAFNAWNHNDQTPAGWIRNSQTTLLNNYSQVVEAVDMNDQYTATRMDANQTRVIAMAANARYHEFSYSGAEDGAIGNALGNGIVLGTGASLTTDRAHTGASAVQTSDQGFLADAEVIPGRKYLISVWSTSPTSTLKWIDGNGSVASDVALYPVRNSNGWYLITGQVQPAQNHMKVWTQANTGTVYFDDFRFHPFNVPMASYVCDKWGAVEYILDDNNLFTRYEYDAAGRLIAVYQESFEHGVKKTSKAVYKYSGQAD
jgi:hypothetical protein